MSTSLILFFVLILNNFNSFSATEEELILFAKSKSWQKLLYFEDGESLIVGDRYFLSNNGFYDPLAELKTTIEYLKDNKTHIENTSSNCIFKARRRLISKNLGIKFPKVDCPDYDNWIEGLDVEDLFLVYASSYPNNPASIFGHTYLRFNRKSRKEKSAKKLTGYSFSYQARTDPNESGFLYVYKGISGLYYANLEIKPHYIDVGVYNNFESRDLWEFKINLSEEEKDLFLRHAWEMSITGAFRYYFFDENCSTFVLRMLEAIKPNLSFKTKNELFVVPQVTYREIHQELASQDSTINLSLTEKIDQQHNKLGSYQSDKENEIRKLDYLIDWWKFKNYKANANLKTNEKMKMFDILEKRAAIKQTSSFNFDKSIYKNETPELGHKMSFVSLGYKEEVNGNFRYGFHDFFDPSLGYSDNAFIKFFDLKYQNSREQDFFHLSLINILSLNPLNTVFPRMSWEIDSGYSYLENHQLFFNAGLGISGSTKNLQTYLLIKGKYDGLRQSRLYPSVVTKFKWLITDRLTLGGSLEYEYLKADSQTFEEINFIYSDGKKKLTIGYSEDSLQSTLGFYF